jgi:hypothetical protein
MLRSGFLALIAAIALSFAAATPAAAQKQEATSPSAVGQWNGWVQWGGEDPLNNITWTFNSDGTLATDTQTPEYGYWVQVGEYVELLYPCTSGRFICHYRGTLRGNVISGSATSNQGHTATFEMRRR